jgi:threonine dehydrogenase-like Zn-dependent dehydrogenase
MNGEFTFPVKYGYSLVGRCLEGPRELLGQRVHVMHPHQDRCVVDARNVFVVPADLPARRATLASNLETAVNAIWDSPAQVGERAVVVGFGIVGSLVARVFSMIPGSEVLVVETDAGKREMAKACGFRAAESASAGQFDLAFECSGSGGGLQEAIDAPGREGRTVLVSWYGTEEARLRLGGAFHYQRKRIISSQVSTLPAAMQARWDFVRRKELVFRLLRADVFDQHITHEVQFEALPEFFHSLCDSGYQGLSAAVRFRGAA